MTMNTSARLSYGANRYGAFAKQVIGTGEPVMSRGDKLTYELFNASVEMTNPVDRVVTDPDRKFNLPFAVSEWLSFMFNDPDASFPSLYISDYAKWGTDASGKLSWHYGTRLHAAGDSIAKAVQLLKEDRFCRQVWLPTFQPSDLFLLTGSSEKYPPCCLGMQLLYRDGKLHMITDYRSNDVYLGFGYDVFTATMIQEWVARQVGMPLGSYFHNAHSLHVYDEHVLKLTEIGSSWNYRYVMPEMPDVQPVTLAQLKVLYEMYKDPRSEYFWDWLPYMGEWCGQLALMARLYVHRKDPADWPEAQKAYEKLAHRAYRHMARVLAWKALGLGETKEEWARGLSSYRRPREGGEELLGKVV